MCYESLFRFQREKAAAAAAAPLPLPRLAVVRSRAAFTDGTKRHHSVRHRASTPNIFFACHLET